MNLRDYYESLGSAERDDYARRAGFSPTTLRIKFFPMHSGPKSSPRLRGVRALADASQGRVSWTEAFSYFAEAGAPAEVAG